MTPFYLLNFMLTENVCEYCESPGVLCEFCEKHSCASHLRTCKACGDPSCSHCMNSLQICRSCQDSTNKPTGMALALMRWEEIALGTLHWFMGIGNCLCCGLCRK